MTENAKIQAEVVLNADQAIQGFKKLESAGEAASKNLEDSARKAREQIKGMGDGSKEAADKVVRETKRISTAIETNTLAAQAGGRNTAAFFEARAKALGANVDLLKPQLELLKSIEAQQQKTTAAFSGGAAALGNMGMSAKQTAAALRQVPAQFTDIIVSLQGGQAPLTVLLQQGGQLKDVFGGAGNAARALGGYIAGLVNPFTIAAAAVGGVAFAFEKGAQEQREFQKTLILTGNAAGATAGQLSAAAARIDQFSGATQGKAAEALNIFANAGIKGIDALERYTATAIEFERAGGGAIDKVAESFAKLGKDPLKASLELNESTNFLTRSLYEQIKALEDQGKKTEAARVAQEAYNASLNDRTPQLLQNLGYIERGWIAIKDATKGAFDAALNVGRTDPIAEARNALASSQARLERLQQLGPGVDNQRAIASQLARVDAAKQVMFNLQEQEKLERKISTTKSEQAATVKAQVEYDKIRDQYLDKRLQREREIAKVTEAAQQAGKPVDDFVIAGINKKYEDKGAVADTNRGISAQIEALKAGAAVKAEIAKQEADTRSSEFKRGIINELQFIEQEKQANLDSLASRKSILQQELKLASGKKDSQQEQAKLAGEIALNEQQSATVIIKAQNDIAEAKFKQARASEAVYQAQRDEDLAAQTAFMLANASARNAGEKAVRDYAKSIQESIDFTKFEIGLMGQSDQARAVAIEQYKIQIDLKKQLEAINSNTGFDSADRAAQTAAATAAAATASAAASSKAFLDEWKKTTDTISSSLTDALLRGFESGKGFGDNLKDTFKSLSKTLVLKPIIEMPVKQAVAALAPLQQKFSDFIATQIFGQEQLAASAVTGSATIAAAKQVEGQAAATAGVANQAGGDPYTAFFRMAAMAALMAGLGYAVKVGGGGSAPVTNQGTGTVFGDPTAKSASIENSIELLADTSKLGLRYSAQMANSLKNIEAAFSGVTNLLLRNGQIGALEGSIATGTFATDTSRAVNAALNVFTFGIYGLIDKVFGGALGSFANKLFGKKISIQGSGIIGGPQSFGDIQDIGFQGNYYADIQTKRKFLGITTSTKNSTVLRGLDQELSLQFTQIFSGIGDSVTAAANALGIRTEFVEQRLSDYIVDIGKIDLKGLNGEEIQKKLSAVFGAEADKIASAVIPGFEEIQRVGEGYFETLVRAATQLESVDTALKSLGMTLGGSYVTGITDSANAALLSQGQAMGVQRAINADKLVQKFGGLDKFNESTAAFYDAFYSQSEKTRNTFNLLDQSLKGIGLTLPNNISSWRDLTTSLDLSTEAGRETFEALVTLGPAFAELQQSLLDSAGISGSAIADVLREGMLGRITQADIGSKLSSIIIDGIYNSLANGFAEQISNTFTSQIISPLLQSIATGGVLSASISQASIDTVVATATNAANQLAAILGDKGFQSAIAGVQAAINGISGAFAGKVNAPAATAIQTYGSLGGAVSSASDAASKGVDAWKSIGDSLTAEIDRIRGVLTGGDKASALASFATLTAQARAGDMEAGKLLPSASQAYIKAVEESATSLLDIRRAQGFALSSLMETRSIIGQGPASSSPTSFTPSFTPSYSPAGPVQQNNDALIAEVKALRAEVAALKPYAQTTADVLDKASKVSGSGALAVEVQ